MPKKLHQLKIDYDYAIAKLMGLKPFEIRMNDRNYKAGDLVCYEVLNKHLADTEYVKKMIEKLEQQTFIIVYTTSYRFGLRPGYIVFTEKLYEGNPFDVVGERIKDIENIIAKAKKENKNKEEIGKQIAVDLLRCGYEYNKFADEREKEV